MWFDVTAAVTHLQQGKNGTLLSVMTESNISKIAEIAEIAGQRPQNLKLTSIARTDGLDADAGEYLDFLHLYGPATYGAAAVALGWGATRAWQAETQLMAAGLVQYDSLGKAAIAPDKSVSGAVQHQCLNPPVAPEIRTAVFATSGKYERKPNA